ncbi:hypothetical protein APF79_10925 [bacterium BRH_c32]|nr:MAG: hypothetical protein APF79_10925 [bacterium BRH_c32]
MITALIFFAHIMFILVIFTKKWQDESLASGLTNAALIVVLFAVGWSISTTLIKIVFEPQGLGMHYDSDAIALTLLAIAEFFFYKMYYKEKPKITVTEKEK